MSVTIGPWTLDAPPDKTATLRPMMELLTKRFELPDGTSRVQPATVVLKPRNAMPWAVEPGEDPKYPNGVRAQGFFFDRPHRIELNQEMVPVLLIRTFAHEAMHHLDADWLRRSNKQDIKPLFAPMPAGFPSEPYAVHASAAIAGFTNPPYKTFYPTPKMAEANYAKLAAFSLRDDRPVDPCKDLRAELEAEKAKNAALAEVITGLRTELDAERAAHLVTQTALAVAESRIVTKDAKMTEGLAA